jgi:hypothetical protein
VRIVVVVFVVVSWRAWRNPRTALLLLHAAIIAFCVHQGVCCCSSCCWACCRASWRRRGTDVLALHRAGGRGTSLAAQEAPGVRCMRALELFTCIKRRFNGRTPRSMRPWWATLARLCVPAQGR